MSDYRDEAWLREQYYGKGRGATDIADECSVSPGTITYWLGKHNIETRSQSEAQKLVWEDGEYSEHQSDVRSGDKNHMHGRTGQENPNYDGGYDGGWRQGKKWQRIRKAVYEKADHKCESCGDRGQLHAHHITPVSEGGDKYNFDNLLCLCRSCHDEVHGGDR